jgi:PKD repeat protein
MTGTVVPLTFGVVFGASFASAQQPEPAYFSASPASGKAPLVVKFCASAGIAIDFGDGTNGSMTIAQEGTCPHPDSVFTTHTYEKAGAYRLRGFPCPGVNASRCGAVAGQANAVTIEVTD